MRIAKHYFFTTVLLLALVARSFGQTATDNIVSHVADPAKDNIQFFWKDDKGNIFRSIDNLKRWLDGRKTQLVFAMNGGMYMEDYRPLGLYIENGKKIRQVNRDSGYGNFYMMPNGILYVTDKGKAVVCKTQDYKSDAGIKYATQSGPLLVINGTIHSSFKKGSANVHIRNGVGILPDGKVLFAISKTPVNLYDFAEYFKSAGCKNALFLDGFVSRAWIPAKNWTQTDGDFGAIIAVTK